MPGILDHLIMLLIIVGAPLDGVIERRKMARAESTGAPGAKLVGYARIMRWRWGAAAVDVFPGRLIYFAFQQKQTAGEPGSAQS